MANPILVNLSFLSNKPTGLTNYAVNLIQHLQPLDLTLLTNQEFNQFISQSIPKNLTSDHGSKGHFLRLVWTQFQLPYLYKTLKSRLLFSPIPEAPLFSRCRSVVMAHDLIPIRFPKRFSPLTPYFRYYVPQVLSQAKHIVCNSIATAKDVAEFCQIPANKITPIPLGYDANHFKWLNLPTQNYFLYIGRSDPHKNLGRLIAAFAKLPPHLKLELWIAGSPDPRYGPNLVAQANELGIGTRLKWLDYAAYEQLPILINQAIALVFPSLWEGFGLPVLEAMACGTPVITSNCSSLPEVAGEAGILVDPYRVEEIADAMYQIATDSGLRSQLRQLGLSRATQFSWAKTGQATAEILQHYL